MYKFIAGAGIAQLAEIFNVYMGFLLSHGRSFINL